MKKQIDGWIGLDEKGIKISFGFSYEDAFDWAFDPCGGCAIETDEEEAEQERLLKERGWQIKPVRIVDASDTSKECVVPRELIKRLLHWFTMIGLPEKYPNKPGYQEALILRDDLDQILEKTDADD